MLGQPLYMVTPQVVGFRLAGASARGHDRDRSRAHGDPDAPQEGRRREVRRVLRPGARRDVSLADRATIANMAPEYGATMRVLPGGRRDASLPRAGPVGPRRRSTSSSATARSRGCSAPPRRPDPEFTRHAGARSRPPSSRAWPGPSGRRTGWPSRSMKASFRTSLSAPVQGAGLRPDPDESRPLGAPRDAAVRQAGAAARLGGDRGDHELHQHLEPVGDAGRGAAGQEGGRARADGAALRQDQPGAGLEGGDRVPAQVAASCRISRRSDSTSWATAARPASATPARCPPAVAKAIADGQLVAAAVLSGNRNFEGRVNPHVQGQLPGLAAARGGLRARRHDGHRPRHRAARQRPRTARRCACADIWPTPEGDRRSRGRRSTPRCSPTSYGNVFDGNPDWNAIPVAEGDQFDFARGRRPTSRSRRSSRVSPSSRRPCTDIDGARVLAMLGDSVTTDHISPAGDIAVDSPAGRFLVAKGLEKKDFNSYGSRRGNDRVMVRGTFANIRLKNLLVPGSRGRRHRSRPVRRADGHLRRRRALPGRGDAAGGGGRQGVRHRLVARLGGQGHAAARASGR